VTCLLINPTQLELSRLSGAVGKQWQTGVCGFGPVQAGVRAVELLHRNPKPQLCILAGIAGTFQAQTHPIGSTWAASQLHLHGVGASDGDQYIPADEMGLPPEMIGPTSISVEQTLELPECAMLTTCTASGSTEEAQRRLAMYPDMALEEMEGYAIALAARQADVPFACIRAVSNIAGDRDKANWQIDAALDALAQTLKSLCQ